MCPLCQVLALFLSLCQAESSTCSSLHAVPSSVCTPAAVVCTLCIAEQWGSAFREAQCSQSCTDSVLMPRKKNVPENTWQKSKAFREFLEQREVTNSLAFVPNSSSKVPLMSVWGEPRACELVSHLCSTRASACPALASVWLCVLEEIDASGRIPAGWSCQQGHSRSSTCYWAGAGDVQGHALCRCPVNNLVFLTGWLSF